MDGRFLKEKYVPFLDAYTKAVGLNEYYENVLRIISLLSGHELKALPIGHEKWYEIDDKQDLDIAEALFADEQDVLRKYYGRYGGFWRFPQMLDYCYLVNPYFPSQRMKGRAACQFRHPADGVSVGNEGQHPHCQQMLWGQRTLYRTG